MYIAIYCCLSSCGMSRLSSANNTIFHLHVSSETAGHILIQLGGSEYILTTGSWGEGQIVLNLNTSSPLKPLVRYWPNVVTMIYCGWGSVFKYIHDLTVTMSYMLTLPPLEGESLFLNQSPPEKRET